MRTLARGLAALILMVLLSVTGRDLHAQSDPVLVMAAASLKNVFDQVGADWMTESGKKVAFSYAASSTLAKQIEQGAPADVFASADLAWMDYLDQRGFIRTGTRTNLLGNVLVLIVPADTAKSITLAKDTDLSSFIGDGRLAVGNVNAVPAGKYAKQALQALDLWTGVEDKLAQVDSVRAALALVARGEAAAGIVYATDAKSEPLVKVVATFPAESHVPVTYPVAVTAASSHRDAGSFLAYLRSKMAQRAYAAHGFTYLE
ncbi:MAG: molybdate ABC transporter substrate-binding protein [Defluviicoccus sp.]|nr:molybdate ABC transporter substrate-binding protein [Defluviicoccus sp.]MDG4607933.1 molybdate ABC transporter substrate-binding protein [Defluviicoccus sp.]